MDRLMHGREEELIYRAREKEFRSIEGISEMYGFWEMGSMRTQFDMQLLDAPAPYQPLIPQRILGAHQCSIFHVKLHISATFVT